MRAPTSRHAGAGTTMSPHPGPSSPPVPSAVARRVSGPMGSCARSARASSMPSGARMRAGHSGVADHRAGRGTPDGPSRRRCPSSGVRHATPATPRSEVGEMAPGHPPVGQVAVPAWPASQQIETVGPARGAHEVGRLAALGPADVGPPAIARPSLEPRGEQAPCGRSFWIHDELADARRTSWPARDAVHTSLRTHGGLWLRMGPSYRETGSPSLAVSDVTGPPSGWRPDVDGLRLVLGSTVGDVYRVRVSDDGSVVALWRP